jgi:hypothetical protein
MAKTKISEWSATPANNTDIDNINIAEGCAPSGINDAIREMMAQVKDLYAGTSGDIIAVAAGGTGVGTSTGSGSNVLSTSPTLVTPALGTPSALVGTNITGTATSFNINGTVGATTPTTGAFTTLAASGAVTLSGGTANGVAYLNGSKVVTSGSALTFDGTKLVSAINTGATTTYPAYFDNTGAGSGTGSRIGFRNSGTSYGELGYLFDGAFGFILDSAGSASSRFLLGGSEQMRLTSTGLGIGTSSPATKLEVDRSTTASASATGSTTRTNSAISVAAGSDTNTRLMFGIDTNTNGWIQAQNTSSSGTASIILNPVGGNLGLGVTPSAWYSTGYSALQVRGSSLYGTSGNDTNLASNAFVNTTPVWAYIATGTATRYEQGSGAHAWYTAASGTAGNAITFTQAMTLDASGNLLVGTTSNTGVDTGVQRLVVNGIAGGNGGTLGLISDSLGRNIIITDSSKTAVGAINISSTQMSLGTNNGYPLIFNINGSERARIDSSGNLLVGCTSFPSASVGGFGIGGLSSSNASSSGSSTAAYNHLLFYNGNGIVGSISTSGTTTTYSTSSDYRLKNTIAPITGALAKVALLKPCTYKWNADGSNGEGFIAHELAEVCPDAVVGEKDAVDEDGNPKYQGIDTSFLVATLTAALQEQQAIIESLKARLDAANL